MKTNEAPEKIYMTPSFGEPDNVLLASFSKSHLNFHRDIEYVRTDAFIEKAVQYLKDHKEEIETEDNGIAGWIHDYFIENFRKYMEE